MNTTTLLKTINQNKNISLYIPDSLFNVFESDLNGLTLINREYERTTRILKLKSPLKDSAKVFNKLEVKTINKKFSLFNQLKNLLYNNRNKTYLMMFKGNSIILRFLNMQEDLIKEYKIRMEAV